MKHVGVKGMLKAEKEFTKYLEALDAQAVKDMKSPERRKQVVAMVTRVRMLLREACWSYNGSDWGKLFRTIDTDLSGKISFEEFVAFNRRKLKLTEDIMKLSWLWV